MQNVEASFSVLRDGTGKVLSDRLVWVESERKRHCIYRRKESAFWNMQLMTNAKQPRKLWKTIQSVTGTGIRQQQNGTLTADDLFKYFNDKVEGVRQSTGNVPVHCPVVPTTCFCGVHRVCGVHSRGSDECHLQSTIEVLLSGPSANRHP